MTDLFSAVVLCDQSFVPHVPQFGRAPHLELGKSPEQEFIPVPVFLIVHPVLLRVVEIPDRFRFVPVSPCLLHAVERPVFLQKRTVPPVQKDLFQILRKTRIIVNSELQFIAELHAENRRFVLPRDSRIRVHMVQQFADQSFPRVPDNRIADDEPEPSFQCVLTGPIAFAQRAEIQIQIEIDALFFPFRDEIVHEVEPFCIVLEVVHVPVVRNGPDPDRIVPLTAHEGAEEGDIFCAVAFDFFPFADSIEPVAASLGKPEEPLFDSGKMFKFEAAVRREADASVFSGRPRFQKPVEIQRGTLLHLKTREIGDFPRGVRLEFVHADRDFTGSKARRTDDPHRVPFCGKTDRRNLFSRQCEAGEIEAAFPVFDRHIVNFFRIGRSGDGDPVENIPSGTDLVFGIQSVGEMELDETLTSRDTVNSKMRIILDEATDPWGIKINRVELKNILPPKDIQEAMEKQMRAERERREAILIAEGEKKSNILVAEGDYVSTGQAIATVSQNRRLVLRADVPEKEASKRHDIADANFILSSDSKRIYNVKALNGRLVSYGKNIDAQSFFIPVTFEIDNTEDLIPGAYADIYLTGRQLTDVISLPKEAITEEQGLYFVYLQIGKEVFKKQEVTIGSTDGKRTEILSGLKAGDKAVVSGAYQVKLASLSGAIPEGHSHSH